MAGDSPRKNAPREVSAAEAFAPGSRARVVEAGWVRLRRTGRVVAAASDEVRFSRGDLLVVRSDRGDSLAEAVTASDRRTLQPDGVLRVVRRLHPAERDAILARIAAQEKEARAVFQREVRRHGLEMHLSGVEIMPGDSRIVFYFTAPGRVDFRALVRDLAGALRTRIELRQIGVRDETRCTGGIGPCGRPLCCATFLREFSAVTIRMAKTQGLVLNPQKLSGVCGRLMCCLAYEQGVYCELRREFPKVGSLVNTPNGEGKVREVLILRREVRVALASGEQQEFPLEQVKWSPDEAGRDEEADRDKVAPEEADTDAGEPDSER